jgi:hypothetical protein
MNYIILALHSRNAGGVYGSVGSSTGVTMKAKTLQL